MKTAFLYTDEYFSFDYGTGHPLRIERLRLTYELCSAYGLFKSSQTRLVETRAATEKEVLRFHSASYIDVLKRASRGEVLAHPGCGLGVGDNPVFSGLWQWSLLHAGASLQCADLVARNEVNIAFNIAGGLHHAGAERAFGFCYINDPVLTIDRLLDQADRVMYLDLDAHHGDGVQWAYYDDPRVLTVSFHQDGRSLFPGTGGITENGNSAGKGYAVNVPMLPGSDDKVFLKGFNTLVPALVSAFEPHVLVTQLGVDSFRNDPLAALEMTTNGFSRAIEYFTRSGIPWVALGGGGYNPTAVARAWTLAWAIMNGVDLSDEVPPSMIVPLSGEGPRVKQLRDWSYESPRQKECLHHMEACIRHVEKKVLPKIASL